MAICALTLSILSGCGSTKNDTQTSEEVNFETPSYEGHYTDADENTIEFTSTPTGIYNVEIGIVGLTSFSGEGNIMDGAVEFSVKDPNDGDVYGIFYPDNGEYALNFTQSDWELLESNTIFSGFTPDK